MFTIKGSVPHDLGSLQDSPLVDYNGYIWRNCNYWKDLNAKFVLLIYRDYLNDQRKDKAFLKATWPAVKAAIHYLQAMDQDGDGIPENSGFPDQTYDNWIMSGASSYCGSLWLACLLAGQKIAGLVGQKSEQRLYQQWFKKAKPAFVKKLWNGKYFDCYENCDDILSDQLNGQWYVHMLQLPDLFTKKQITGSLRTIYDFNVSSFGNGFRGVVNGRKSDGKHCGHEQGDDAWVGTSFAVAALMMQNGLKQEAMQVLIGLYQTIYLEKGLFFRTPEGWREDGNFVGSMYMRAGAVWSLFF
jgi:non-lysosomal glucosylceramidase